MEHFEVKDLSKFVKANVAKLAVLMDDIAKRPKAGFDMMCYYSDNVIEELAINKPERAVRVLHHDCQTTACAAGWAYVSPAFEAARQKYPSLEDFIKHAFGTECNDYFDRGNQIFSWLFSSAWNIIDNTPQGVAARARYMLTHGVPKQEMWTMDNKEVRALYKEFLK